MIPPGASFLMFPAAEKKLPALPANDRILSQAREFGSHRARNLNGVAEVTLLGVMIKILITLDCILRRQRQGRPWEEY